MLEKTKHAACRMQQRAIHEDDVDLVLELGTDLENNRIYLSRRDADRAVRDLKRRIRQIEGLRGTTLVVVDGKLVTAYTTDRFKRCRRRS